jgi:hypothetical protein
MRTIIDNKQATLSLLTYIKTSREVIQDGSFLASDFCLKGLHLMLMKTNRNCLYYHTMLFR